MTILPRLFHSGVWHDYVSTNDHSETTVDSIMGITYLSVTGDKFEVPGTLGEQWAFDPKAVYKSAPVVIRELVAIVAKGKNINNPHNVAAFTNNRNY